MNGRDSSNLGPLTKLCAALARAGVDLDELSLAEAVWLAESQRLGRHTVAPRAVQPIIPPSPRPSKPGSRRRPSPKGKTSPSESGERLQEPRTVDPEIPLVAPAKDSPARLGGRLTLATPVGRALPGGHLLSRALRGLKRPIPAKVRKVLDEEATIRRFSEEGLWLPVLRPARARWLEVALVIDDSSSMMLWQATLREFRLLLDRQGAFRDVRVWRLDSGSQGPRLFGRVGTVLRRPEELIDPAGRRLVLIASDCIGAAWRGSEMAKWLNLWGSRQPVAIVQLLPMRLWPATNLSAALEVEVRSAFAGAPPHQLKPCHPGSWLDASMISGAPIPVFPLEPAAILAWANVLIGSGDAKTPAFVWDANAASEEEAWDDSSPGGPSRKEIVARFQAVASEPAKRLAHILAAAPLRLPIMRLLQQVMLPQSSQDHLAEVLFSGLLTRLNPSTTDPDEIEFDFLPPTRDEPGVRDLLLSDLFGAEVAIIRSTVGKDIETRYGINVETFAASIPAGGSSSAQSLVREFARISALALRRFGPNYQAEADRWENAGKDFDQPSPEVAGQSTRAERPTEQRGQLTDNTAAEPQTYVQLSINVFQQESATRFEYDLRSPTLGWHHRFESPPLNEGLISQIYEDIARQSPAGEPQLELFETRLKEIGAGLLNVLFPAQLQQALWEQRDRIDTILVLSEASPVPWEILYLEEPGRSMGQAGRFLCELGLVRWLHGIRPPTETLRARTGRCCYIIPHYPHPGYQMSTPALQKEAAFLEQKFSARRVEPHLDPVRQILEGPGAFDLLHFAGHANPNLGNLAGPELLLEGRIEKSDYLTEVLPASIVEQSANLVGADGTHPMVVLNASDIGRVGYKLGNSFASAFLRVGAGVFVSALWYLSDESAVRFMAEFYERLLAGEYLARATFAARQKARMAGDACWLGYTVYGHPNARLVREAPQPLAGHIVWVDDHPQKNHEEIKRLIEKGAEVTQVRSTEEALRAFTEKKFDAVISEQGRLQAMPYGLADLALLDAMRERGLVQPFVIYSEAASPQFRRQVLAHLGQEATHDFNIVISTLERALASPIGFSGHLGPDRVHALAIFFGQNGIAPELASVLNLDPTSTRWQELWSAVSGEPGRLAVQLVAIAFDCSYVQLFDFLGHRLILRADFVEEGKARYQEAALAGAIGQAARTGATVRLDDVQNTTQPYIPTEVSTRSELAVPVKDASSNRVLALFNLESPWVMAFGPLQVRWLEGLAASIGQKLGAPGPSLDKPPPVYFKDSLGTDPEDRNKGRFGGQSSAFGRSLTAEVNLAESRATLFQFDLVVRSIDGSALRGPIYFYLHDSFRQPTIRITKVTGSPSEARVEEVTAYETFTVGVQVKDGADRWIKLELDLAAVPEAHRWLPLSKRQKRGVSALVFQSNPYLWSLLENLKPGEEIRWSVSQHRTAIDRGTLVLFWEAKGRQATCRRGLWGWGLALERAKKDRQGSLRVNVRCVENWIGPQQSSAPIPAADVFRLAGWESHRLSTAPRGANFTVSPQQLQSLGNHVAEHASASLLPGVVEAILRGDILNPESLLPQTVEWLSKPAVVPEEPIPGWLDPGQTIRSSGPIEFNDPPGEHHGPFVTTREKHTLHLPLHFRVCPYLTTNEAFMKFVDDDGYQDISYWREVAPGLFLTRDRETLGPATWASRHSFEPHESGEPVSGVCWYEARAFVQWLNFRHRSEGWLWALPTEDMWELAARGPQGLIYPWGNDFAQGLCNCAEEGIGTTTNVRAYPSGAAHYGGQDFSGNVWEHLEGDQPEVQTQQCVLRGGSYKNNREQVKCYLRLFGVPRDHRGLDFGFRCAQVPEEHQRMREARKFFA